MILREGVLKDGRTVTFTYLENDRESYPGREKGFVLHRIDAHLDDKNLGHLTISYVSSDRLDECFPTIWHWVARATGWCFDPDDLVSTWMGCHPHAHRSPKSQPGVGPFGLSRNHLPDEDTMRADLVALEEARLPNGKGNVHTWKSDWLAPTLDRPWVDYIRVLEDHRRLGLGTLLYEAGARWLAETRGYPLWGSSLQTAPARGVWDDMRVKGRLPIREADRGDGKVLPMIDFTG